MGTVIGVHYDGGYCYWYIMTGIEVLLLGYIMMVRTVIGVHYDGGY